MRVLAWPAHRSRNPYPGLVVASVERAAAAAGRRVEYGEFRPLTAWTASADVVHLHWPELAVSSPSRLRAALKSAAVRLGLWGLRRRGARIVWTRHNTSSHEGHHPDLERRLRSSVERQVAGVIDLHDDDRPPPSDARRAVIRHGDYGAVVGRADRAEARRALGVRDGDVVLAALGSIRPYKQIPELVGAVRHAAATDGRIRLVVAGRPSDDSLADAVRRRADGSDAVTLRLGWVDDAEMDGLVAAADVVVLPYRRLENSGVLLLGLTGGRPVAATEGPAVADALDVVGPDWVLPIGDIDASTIGEVVAWAGAARTGSPDLSAYAWDEIGRRTLALYDAVIDGGSTGS